MQAVIASVVSDPQVTFGHTTEPYQVSGFTWVKDPDQYDSELDVVWEGQWRLVNDLQKEEHTKEKEKEKCLCTCPNVHMIDHFCYQLNYQISFEDWIEKCKKNLIENQKKAVSQTFCEEYYMCTHETHTVCTNSICCDLFYHDGECHFNDGNGGYAVLYGDQ